MSRDRKDMTMEITIRSLRDVQEFQGCVDLQKTVWGFDEVDVMPLRFFIVASRTGGQVFGAFNAQGGMIGFLCAIAGVKDNMPYIHSHMLAVLPEYRNQGIARRLKLAQRTDAVERAFQLVEWTFDPLELKNAYFNIEKLGVIVRHYSVNHYGLTTSKLQAGLPTDRLFAEWWIQSPRVQRVLSESQDKQGGEIESAFEKLDVPSDVMGWKAQDLEKAGRMQRQVRERFLDLFQRGFYVNGFERGEETSSYIFSRNFKAPV
ncbi:MAG: GNAT family N-acetyltransferase [Acidobacteriia bacterium]|nr:GNAT family N-acetyltransferase [Terriglobia bacterium]